MEHLIDIQSITKEDIANIISLAKEFKYLDKIYRTPSSTNLPENAPPAAFSSAEPVGAGEQLSKYVCPNSALLIKNEQQSKIEIGRVLTRQNKQNTLSLMFCENSTRTRCSFEIAGQKLGMNIINFDDAHSSLNKGESLKDTIENLYFLGVNAVVIRHSLSGIINNVLRQVKYPIKFINGGDGTHAHPSQALLDYYTMLEKIGTVEGKKIVIVGDVSHSRVAKSNIALLNKFGAKIHICAPSYLQFENFNAFNVTYHSDLKEAIEGANVVMALRVQNERHEKEGYPDSSEYKRLYEIDSKILKQYAAEDVILMHPGPANRNIEVSSELLDNQVGKTILEQAQNGVYVRMAILNILLGGNNAA